MKKMTMMEKIKLEKRKNELHQEKIHQIIQKNEKWQKMRTMMIMICRKKIFQVKIFLIQIVL